MSKLPEKFPSDETAAKPATPEQEYLKLLILTAEEGRRAGTRSLVIVIMGCVLLTFHLLFVVSSHSRATGSDLIIGIALVGISIIGFFYEHRLAGDLANEVKKGRAKADEVIRGGIAS